MTVINQWIVREFDLELPYMSTRKSVVATRPNSHFEFCIRRSLRYVPLSHRPRPVRSFCKQGRDEPVKQLETPLYVSERTELDQGATITDALIEKYGLETIRTVGKYVLYRSHTTFSAFLCHNTIVIAIGASYHLEPFLDYQQSIEDVLASIDKQS